jgi:geranylgeranyl pyrophosphate synthase
MINDIFANEQNLEGFLKDIIDMMSKYKTEKYCNKILNENFKDSEKIITGLKIKNLNKENLKEINQFLVYRKK